MKTVQTIPNTEIKDQTSLSDARRFVNTKMNGEPFDTATITAVWEKAEKDFGFFFFRRDLTGSVIAKHDYGKKNQYGWEIDHVVPISNGGTDVIANLQPLHWKNCLLKGGRQPG